MQNSTSEEQTIAERLHLCEERLDNAPDWIWELDSQGVFTYSNRVVENVLGYAKQDVLNKKIFELLILEDRPKCRSYFRRAIHQKQPVKNMVVRFRRKDSGIEFLEVNCVPILEADQAVGLRGIAREVTEILCFRTAIDEALANYKAALDNSPTGIVVVQNEQIVYANPKITELMGYKLDDLKDKGVWQFVHPDDKERVMNYYRRRMAGEEAPEQYEIRVITKSGEVRHFELRATVITYQGAPAVLDNIIDITERRKAESALKDSEERFRLIAETASDAIITIDKESTILYANPAAEHIFGYTANEMLGQKLTMLMPESFRERHLVGLRRYLETGKKTREWRSIEYPGLHKSGREIPLEISYSEFTRAGEHIFMGILRDITDRKRAQDDLRESEERYRMLFEHSPDIVIALKNNVIVAANPAITRILGYEIDEVIGLKPWDISPEFQPDGFSSKEKALRILERLRDGVPQAFEWVHKRKDGTLVDCDVSLTNYTVHGETYVQAIVRDITERKRAEEHRRALEKQLDEQKRQFYRDTILSVTGGKLNICEAPQIRPYISKAKLKINVSGAHELAQARREVEIFCRKQGLEGERLDYFMIGVGEALTNAVKHASGGRVYAGVKNGSVWVGVSDRGSGIGSLILPRAVLLRGFSTKPSLGLGYTIMLEVADEVLLKTGDRGTTVVLVKQIKELDIRLAPEMLPDTWENIPEPS
jgi:PAS domain S-box-containing protein